MNELQTTDKQAKQVKKYSWKGNKRQRLFLEYWITPSSETFGNAYKSAIKVGFSNNYALNITAAAPQWLVENVEGLNLTTEHIKQGLYELATKTYDPVDSRSPADTRLKAYETLAKISGMIDNKNSTVNVNVVQPILNGESVAPLKTQQNTPTDTHEVIDQS